MDAETLVFNLSGNVAAQAAVMNSALAQLQAQAAGVAARLQQPLKSSSYRDLAAQIKAIDPSAAVPGLDAMSDAEGAAGDSASAAVDGMQSQADASDEVASSASSAADALQNQAGAAEGAGEASAGSSLKLGALAKVAHGLPGPLGGAASHALRLGNALMKLGPEAAIVAAAFLVMAAVIATAIAVIVKGIEAAGAMRDELLKFQGAAKGSAEAAAGVQAAVTAVSSASALSRDKISEYAIELEKAGLKGKALQSALEAMADAGSAGGEEAASAFLKSAKAASGSASAVEALSNKVKKELGGVAAQQALSLGAQFEKLKENIAAIFSGADIEPLLKAMRAILSIFSQTSASGKAMKGAISSFVNYAIGAFIRLVTFVLKAYIAIKTNATAWFLVKAAAMGVLLVIGLLAAIFLIAIAASIAATAVIAAPFVLVGAAIYAIYAAGKAIWTRLKAITWQDIGKLIVYALLLPLAPFVLIFVAARALWNKLKGISWSDVGKAIKNAFLSAVAWLGSLPGKLVALGKSIVTGLVNGIIAAGPAILSALTGIVSGGISAVKSLLGIASPSRVFAAMGAQTGAGMAQGVDDSAGDVQSSMKSMVAPPNLKSGGKGGKSGGFAPQFNNCSFGGDLTQAKLKEMLLGAWEEIALQAEPAR